MPFTSHSDQDDGSRSPWGAWTPDVRDDPFRHLAAARSRCPVQPVRLPDGHDAWVVLDHDAARHALRDPRLSKDMLAAMAGEGEVVAEGLPGPAFARHMLAVDPPEHTRLRRLVGAALTNERVAALEPAIRWRTDMLLDRLEAAASAAGPVDLVDGFAHPLPFGVIGDLVGIPDEDHDHLRAWFRTLLTPGPGEPSPEVVAASDSIVAYLTALVAAKRRQPADDLVSALIAAEGDDGLDEQELLSSIFQLMVAGHDTTTTTISNAVVALLDHPDQRDALVAEPDLLVGAVDELVRFDAPVPHATFRMTIEPVTLAGVEIPAHEQVLVCLAAANRDPGAFAEPDRLDVRRPAARHLGFGFGIHHCLGAPLARLEARIALGTLLGRFPGLDLAVPRVDLRWTRGDGLVLRGLDVLPVHLSPPSS